MSGSRKESVEVVAPTWQELNGCELLWCGVFNPAEALTKLPITNAAYVRCPQGLYYVNKQTKECFCVHEEIAPLSTQETITINDEEIIAPDDDQIILINKKILRFDYELKITKQRSLTEEELVLIENITGHMHRTKLQNYLYRFGRFCAYFVSIGSGFTNAAAFVSLNLITGGLATGILAALLFIAAIIGSWLVFKKYVPAVLIDLFGREKFFIDEKGEPLSTGKKIAMGIALVLSLSVGITFAALGHSSILALPTTFTFLAVLSPVLPFFAPLLTMLTFICISALMFKDIAKLIQMEDMVGECRKFLKELFSTDLHLPQNQGKSPERIRMQQLIIILMVVIFIPLALIALVLTMKTCMPGLKAILVEKLPHLSLAVADTVAKVVCLGLAFVGQLPFTIQSIFYAASSFFTPKNPKGEGAAVIRARSAKFWEAVQVFQIFVNSIASGIMAMVGVPEGSPVMEGVALGGGTVTSVLASLAGAAVEVDCPKPPPEQSQCVDLEMIMKKYTEPGKTKGEIIIRSVPCREEIIIRPVPSDVGVYKSLLNQNLFFSRLVSQNSAHQDGLEEKEDSSRNHANDSDFGSSATKDLAIR